MANTVSALPKQHVDYLCASILPAVAGHSAILLTPFSASGTPGLRGLVSFTDFERLIEPVGMHKEPGCELGCPSKLSRRLLYHPFL